MGQVRVSGGYHGKRNISFPDGHDIRPSSSRVRKVLFDWLRFIIQDKQCLDLFSGSGILAFEALSQGASSVLAIDHNQTICSHIQSEANRLSQPLLEIKCETIPCPLDTQFDICFMDPPFKDAILYQKTIAWLAKVIKPNGYLYIESDHQLSDLEGWQLLKYKKVASVWMQLYQRDENGY